MAQLSPTFPKDTPETVDKAEHTPQKRECGRESRWANALNLLNDDEKLQLQVESKGQDHLSILKDVLDLAAAKKRTCLQKGWKFKGRSGKVIVVRDILDRTVVWVQKFKEVGDIAVSYDPVHAALPWAAVRFLLSVAVGDAQTFGLMAEGIERVAMLVTRYEIFERMYLDGRLDDEVGFEPALVNLYASILRFECSAIRYYGKNTADRILSGVLLTSEKSVEKHFNKIIEAQANVDACARIIDAGYQRETGNEIRVLGDTLQNNGTKLDVIIEKLNLTLTPEVYIRLGTILQQLEGLNARSAHPALEDAYDSDDEAREAKEYAKLLQQERGKIFRWLSRVPFDRHQKLKRKECLADSCQWLLDSDTFKEWKRSKSSSILWLHGIAGSGKSVLVSSVIDDFQKDQLAGVEVAQLGYFYCARNTAEPERASPEEILRSILLQVCSTTANDPIKEPVVKAYKKRVGESEERGQQLEHLTIEEATEILLEILEGGPATIIIDALDECDPEERHNLLSALDTIIIQSASLVRVFVSSRDDGDIVCQLTEAPNVFIRASDNSGDIRRYVHTEVSDAIKKKRIIRGNVSPEMKQRIIDTLIDGAQGMFRWVRLQIQHLCDHRRVKHEGDIILELGRLPKPLHDSYNVIYTSITELAGASQMLPIRTMKFLLCAQRTLTPAELLAAVTIDPLTNNPLVSSEHDLLDACCNLIFRDREFNTFRFAHLSVREYLESRADFGPKQTHLFALDRCLGTLLYNSRIITPTEASTSSELEFIHVQNQTLQGYAKLSWPSHCQLVPVDQVEASSNLRLFIDTEDEYEAVSSRWKVAASSELSNYYNEFENVEQLMPVPRPGFPDARQSHRCHSEAPPLTLVASFYGLSSIIRRLMSCENIPWDIGPCITIAAERGYLDIVEILLNRQNSQYRHGEQNELIGCRTLRAAVKQTSLKHGTIAKALVNHGVNVHYCGDPETFSTLGEDTSYGARLLRSDIDNYDPKNALIYSAINGDEELVQLLLEHGADPNSTAWSFDSWSSRGVSRNALEYASSIGVIERLVEAGADVEHALFSAVRNNNKTLISVLLARGVSINIKDQHKKTPLHYAVESGSVDIFKMLLADGADIHAKDAEGRTAIHYSICCKPILRQLIQLGLDIDTKDRHGETALFLAAEAGLEEIVGLLVEGGADVNLRGRYNRTAIFGATSEGNGKVVQLLISHGADIEATDDAGRTPLFGAVRRRHKEVIKMLLFHGAKIDTEAKPKTILDVAVKRGPRSLVKLILAHGDWDARKLDYPLRVAAERGHRRLVTLLLERGADIDTRNRFGATPLLLAINSSRVAMTRYLIEKGASIIVEDNAGRTSFYLAVEQDLIETVVLLIDKGADVHEYIMVAECLDKPRESEGTLLHLASLRCNEEMIRLLLAYNVDIDATNKDGKTALHIASGQREVGIVKTLVRSGASADVKDQEGNTPLDIARKLGNTEVVKVLTPLTPHEGSGPAKVDNIGQNEE